MEIVVATRYLLGWGVSVTVIAVRETETLFSTRTATVPHVGLGRGIRQLPRVERCCDELPLLSRRTSLFFRVQRTASCDGGHCEVKAVSSSYRADT